VSQVRENVSEDDVLLRTRQSGKAKAALVELASRSPAESAVRTVQVVEDEGLAGSKHDASLRS
jgi:hypothetical protein